VLKRDYKLNINIYKCPGAAGISSTYLQDSNNNDRASFYYSNYGYNSYYIGGSFRYLGLAGHYTPAKLSQLKHTSTTLLTVDSFNGANPSTTSTCVVNDSGKGSLRFHDRHNGGANILWADGHVTYEKNSFARIQQEPTHKYFKREH